MHEKHAGNTRWHRGFGYATGFDLLAEQAYLSKTTKIQECRIDRYRITDRPRVCDRKHIG